MVDGSALLDLTEQDVKDICKKIGPTKKIYKLIAEVSSVHQKIFSNADCFRLQVIQKIRKRLLMPFCLCLLQVIHLD